jgi:hypothetical protein
MAKTTLDPVADDGRTNRSAHHESDFWRAVPGRVRQHVHDEMRPSGLGAAADGRREVLAGSHAMDRSQQDDLGRQLRATLAATAGQDGATGARAHAQAEAVLAGTAAVVRLVRTLAHEWFLTQGVESSRATVPGSGSRHMSGCHHHRWKRAIDGHRSFTDLRPVNTRRVSRRPTSQRYGRAGDRSNRRPLRDGTPRVQTTRRPGIGSVPITLALVWRRC